MLEPNWPVRIRIFRAFSLGVLCAFELICLSSPIPVPSSLGALADGFLWRLRQSLSLANLTALS